MVDIAKDCLGTLLLFCVLFLSVVYVAEEWDDEAKLRYAEHIASEFLSEASAHGYVAAADYERLKANLAAIDTSYQAECSQIIRLLLPIYGYRKEAELAAYYAGRNVRKAIVLEEVSLGEEPAQGNLQDFDNATLLAGSGGVLFVPLPEEDIGAEQTAAVAAVQKVYTKEPIVTLCRIDRGGSTQFLEAEQMSFDVPGTYQAELTLQGRGSGIFVEVTVCPRSLLCDKGHCYANTKERIAFYEISGVLAECPYCAELPEQIVLSDPIVCAAIGTTLSEMGLCAYAHYKDGREELVLPGSDGWQDDYDAGYCGIQLVTVCYQGSVEYYLTVVTEGGSCKNCGRECKNRCYADYESLPYCDKCLEGMPVYGGNLEVSEYIEGQEAFLAAWEANGCYFLQQGGSLQVVVTSFGKRILGKETVIRSRAGE